MKIKHLLLSSILTSVIICQSFGQDNIVNWTFEVSEDGHEKILTATADIKEGWFIYSQDTDPDGPIPTSFELINEQGEMTKVVFDEKSSSIKKFSPLFEIEVVKYKAQAVFTYNLGNYADAKSISGSVLYMCCDNSRCLPPNSIQFEAKI